MGNSRLAHSYLTFWIVSACQISLISAKYLSREYTCADSTLNLKCGDRSTLAIHLAYFSEELQQETTNLTCGQPPPDYANTSTDIPEATDPCFEDLRVSVNKKCSGLKQCEYNYVEQENKKCDFPSKGILVVHYDCVKKSSVHNFCNSRLKLKEGYISSPGYPGYYPQLDNCNWTIEASAGQKVVIQMLHVHMRPPTERIEDDEYPHFNKPTPEEPRCELDFLRLTGGHPKVSTEMCGEDVSSLRQLEFSSSKDVVVRFTTRDFLPASGFLLHYRIQGCRTLNSLRGGYLIKRNGSFAEYACSDGRIFNDSQESHRTLQCIDDRRWNTTLTPCVAREEIQAFVALNHSVDEQPYNNQTLQNLTREYKKSLFSYDTLYEDIVIPAALIVLLTVGNSIIIAVIIIIRKKHKAAEDTAPKDEEISQKRDSLLEDFSDL